MKRVRRAALALVTATLVLAGGPAGAQPPARVAPAPGKALVIFHTRIAPGRAIAEGRLFFRPFDRATGRIEGDGFDAPGRKFYVGRVIGWVSNKYMQEWRGWVREVEPGSYVLADITNPNLEKLGNKLLPRSWAFDVVPGTVTYVGDFTQSWMSRGSWYLQVLAEVDEPRARAFAAANVQSAAPFVVAPARPVLLSRDYPDRKWRVSEAP